MKVGFISAKGGQGVTTLSSVVALIHSEGRRVAFVPSSDTRACLGIASDTVTDNLYLSDTPSDEWDTILDGQPGDYTVLVTRECYLSLRRAVSNSPKFDAVVVIHEDGRALTHRDVEQALGKPVIAVINHDPAVARLVDAGLLSSKQTTALRSAAERILTHATVTVHQ